VIETIQLAQLCTEVGFEFYALSGETLGHELMAALAPSSLRLETCSLNARTIASSLAF
jgi:hypothetical protein